MTHPGKIQQRIYLSRKGANSIEFEHEVLRIPLSIGEETSFEIIIYNHGDPSHLHFTLSEEIEDRVMLLQDNVYVIEEERIAAIVRLPKAYGGSVPEPGEISVSTGYGAVKKGFIVEIIPQQRPIKAKRERTEKVIKELKDKKKELKISPPVRNTKLQRLTVTVGLASLFMLAFGMISLSFHPLIFAIIASSIFFLIVIYNL